MDAELWERVQELLARALELPAGERAAFVEREARDEEQRREVLSLIAAGTEADGFFGDLQQREALPGAPERWSDASGRRVGAWQLDRFLGRGGMGSVYLAHRADGQFEQRAAIKLLSLGASDPEAHRRFLAEREILARLQHPGIAALYDGGVHEDGTPYFVMEYVDGLPIDRYCDEGGLGLEERLHCFLEVCEAVAYAHGQQVVHRDLKPPNILVSDGRVRLLDFGIAKSFAPKGRFDVHQTTTGHSPMTPLYASPEQLHGQPITTATDVYALGVLLHELLVGLSPYDVNLESNVELLHAVCDEPVAAPSTRLRRLRSTGKQEPTELARIARERGLELAALELRLRGDLDTILLEALHKLPRERYPSVDAFADDVRRHLDRRPVLARRDSTFYRLRRFFSRHRVPTVAVGLAALLALALAALGIWTSISSERQASQLASSEEGNRELLTQLTELYESADPEATGAEARAARGMLDRAVERLDQREASDPQSHAALLFAAGRVYRRLGAGDRARPLLEECLALRRESQPAQREDLAAALFELGTNLARTVDSARGVELLTEGLALEIELHGPEHEHSAQFRYELATALHHVGEHERSRAEFSEAVRVYRMLPPQVTYDYASALMALADYLAINRDIEGAIELLVRADEILVELHGEMHPAVARARSGLGMLRYTTGDSAEGIALMREALEIGRGVFGDGAHPDLAAQLQNLGNVLATSGNAEGVDLLREAVDVFSRIDPPQATQRGFCLTLLARALRRFDGAGTADAYEEALEVYEAAGVGAAFQNTPKVELAEFLLQDGGSERAIELLEQAVASYEGLVPDTDPRLTRARALLEQARKP